MDYLKLFSSLPNFNRNKQIVLNDAYNPTLYKWGGDWTISWISDDGDSILDIVGNSPEEAIKNTVEYLKEHYQISIEETLQPTFTLTAEEVEYLRNDLEFTKLVKAEPLTDLENNLLTRIKAYQDEHNK